ncbi:DNA-binding response OmpR family regulator [Mucilaginibacter oryzae]|uniref:DNA-binding response OmpR family regulator n=1 Tax=Mucilaginibacter oryzae TaxID=468058 RepID=A0A316HG93_9SPHI|nr:response regulator transcription factor [Mucilaginibacter oryzae]PWK79193.1 DNA-binding response OmpR family regulator [Mucilaginibacter oryzae]
MHILVVEDEPKVASFLLKGLRESQYHASLAVDVFAAKQALQADDYNVIIIDVLLPDGNGMDLCRYIRKQDLFTPILMLTALNSIDNKVTGLQAGADDYLVKPFHFNELLARIEALLRRTARMQTQPQPGVLTFADLKLNTGSKVAERAGTEIILTAKEYALLELFMQHPNKTLSRDYIAERVWGIDFDTKTNFIDVYVNYLRKKIEKGFEGKLIHTNIGMGYILKERAC